MTNNNQKVYEAIVEYKQAHDGCAPSRDTLVRMTGLAKSSIHMALTNLHEAGRIVKGSGACQIQLPGGEYTFWGNNNAEGLTA